MHRSALSILLLCLSASVSRASVVNWENPPIHPLEITPDGSTLLLTNTADGRLEVFDISFGTAVHRGSIPVGIDPVSVRARSDSEIWVVNHVSDSVSILELPTMRVRLTLNTGDEPTDVVFAGSPERAFVCLSQLNEIRAYDPVDPGAAPAVIPVAGQDPRALATDGTNVYVAVFESGTHTTILSQFEVSDGGPYGGQNPPPNDGAGTLRVGS